MKTTERHVVIGASKGIGRAIVQALHLEGRPVYAMARTAPTGAFELPSGVRFTCGDARNTEALAKACEGATHIYHCVNVPYAQWAQVMPQVTDAIVAAATAESARLIFIGNLYGYGHLGAQPVTETQPLDAQTKKGILRNQLEDKLWQAHRAGDIELVIPRFPDFYGPGIVNGLMAPIFEAALKGKKASWPSSLEQPHALINVRDAAAACVRLGLDEQCIGQSWHVPGPNPLTGGEFLRLVFEAAGEQPRTGILPGWLLSMVGLFSPDAKELVELLYEFEEPMLMDGTRFKKAQPDYRFTPHPEAIKETLEWFRLQA